MKPTSSRLRRSTARSASHVVRLILLTCLAALCAFPVYWMIVTALLPLEHVFDNPPVMVPDVGHLATFPRTLTDIPLLRWFGNSAFVAAGVSIFSVVLGVLSGYALSRFRFRGKNLFAFLLFATQMLPEALALVPIYVLFVTLGLLNALYGLVIIDTVFIMPVVAWIVKAAIDGVPYELEEAAKVDGCTQLGILEMVVLPLVLPSVAAGAVIAFFYGWNEYLFAVTFIGQPDGWTASVGMSSLIGQYVTPLDTVFAGAVLYTIIPVIFYLFAERKLVAGLTRGALKG